MARVRTCNSVKFETSQNLPQVLKIVTCTALVACVYPEVAKHVTDVRF